MNTHLIHSPYSPPFGMLVQERVYTASEYRFGFNGKEKDNEVSGHGNSIEFGFRIYDSRIGRFKSVDPLSRSFPYNSPFAFAENDVIRSIDLEGGERLIKTVTSNPNSEIGEPGKSKIEIKMDYQMVTKGSGAVTSKIYPKIFTDKFAAGNTTLYLKTLPTESSPAEILVGKEFRKAAKANNGNERAKQWLASKNVSYYETDVSYNFTLSKGGSLEEVIEFYEQDKAGRGIVMEPFYDGYNNCIHHDYNQFNSDGIVYLKNPNVGGFGWNEDYYNGKDENLAMIRPSTKGLQKIYSIIHEVGHNMARVNYHPKHNLEYGSYGYSIPGLGSRGEDVSPIRENTENIINDNTNRQTLSEDE